MAFSDRICIRNRINPFQSLSFQSLAKMKMRKKDGCNGVQPWNKQPLRFSDYTFFHLPSRALVLPLAWNKQICSSHCCCCHSFTLPHIISECEKHTFDWFSLFSSYSLLSGKIKQFPSSENEERNKRKTHVKLIFLSRSVVFNLIFLLLWNSGKCFSWPRSIK